MDGFVAGWGWVRAIRFEDGENRSETTQRNEVLFIQTFPRLGWKTPVPPPSPKGGVNTPIDL